MNAPNDMHQLIPAWESFVRAADITTIRDVGHYCRMVGLLGALLG